MEAWQHQFRNIMQDGEPPFDAGDYETALEFFRDAFKLVPDPKRDFEEATRVITAMGDCFLALKEYEKAEKAYADVLLCPSGAANPFIRLRRGQLYHHLGDKKQARVELTTAYMNGGAEVFEGEESWLEMIQDVVDSLGGN